MEKENIYSASLGLGKEGELYGKWAKKNGLFIQLNKDSWHADTQYWIPANIWEKRTLQSQLIEKLVLSKIYKKLEFIDIKTILLPVVEVGDLIICLSQKSADNKTAIELLSSNDFKDFDIWSGFNWQSVDENKLQKESSKIRPIELSFMDLQEEVHYRGGEYLKLTNQNINIFFLPVTIFEFKIKGQLHQWASIDGENSSLTITPLQIEPDEIFTIEEQADQPLTGCLVQICSIAVGVWFVILAWQKLNGGTLLLCLIGIVLLLIFLSKIIMGSIIYLTDYMREKKKQRIIERRKNFLAGKGLVG